MEGVIRFGHGYVIPLSTRQWSNNRSIVSARTHRRVLNESGTATFKRKNPVGCESCLDSVRPVYCIIMASGCHLSNNIMSVALRWRQANGRKMKEKCYERSANLFHFATRALKRISRPFTERRGVEGDSLTQGSHIAPPEAKVGGDVAGILSGPY